jgi:hypothetical protein
MKAFRILGVALAILTLITGPVWAGSLGRIGTAGAPELRLPVGARSIALSGADLAMVSGAEALFYNPAGIVATSHKTEALFSNTQYIANMHVNFVGLTQSVGDWGSIGVSAKVLSIGDIVQTTESAPDGTGETFSPTFSTIGLTYGKAMTDRVNFGGTLYYISEKILQETAAGAAFDFGFQYDTGVHGTKLGVAVKSIGPNMEYSGSDFERIVQVPGDDPQAAGRNMATQSAKFELPTTFQMSLGIPVVQGANPLTVYAAYNSNSFGNDQGKIAAELTLRKMLALRGGYAFDGTSDQMFTYTYGAGLILPLGGSHMTLDWAAQPVHGGYFDDVQNFSVGMTF